MCGFVGYLNYTDGPAPEFPLERMNDALRHRGPDGAGVYRDGPLALAHRRLAIVDLAGGAQPMLDPAGRGAIVYNGELYNYREIKSRLEGLGETFRTDSDTEVVLSAVLRWGGRALELFNGIFAFAVWERAAQRLFLARDPFGVKPLYFLEKNGTLFFASEAKSIIASGAYTPEVDVAALNALLHYRFVPSPGTLFRDIRKLRPGHFLERNGATTTITRYEKPLEPPRDVPALDELCERYLAHLQAAVARQMMADVPVGISLSGGVDSAAITHFASEVSSGIDTFTVGFEGGLEKDNELAPARAVAARYGTRHHEYTIRADEYRDLFEKYLYHLEEPIGTESALAAYFVARMAVGKVKVLLTGQGADEPLAGYPRHVGEKFARAFGRLPQPVVRGLAKLAEISGNERLRRATAALHERNTAARFAGIHAIFPTHARCDLLKPDFYRPDDLSAIESILTGATGDDLNRLLYLDGRFSLADNLLLCADKMSMAAGIEARVPFLDVEFMRFLEPLPSNVKLRGLCAKFIHKRALARVLPTSITQRRKVGFTSPMKEWIKKDLADWVSDRLLARDSFCSQVFCRPHLERLIADNKRGTLDLKRQIFLLVSLEMWHRTFIAGKKN